MKNLLGSKLGKDLLYLGLYAVGLASISMMIYTVGGFISIGGWRPFENYYIRDATILIITAAAAGGIGFRIWRRRKSSEQLAEGIGEAAKEEDDGVVLKDKMKDALATLKKAGGGKGDYLYDLPWYVIIGPPGAGKTTALVNSGLKFPLSRGATPAAVAGVGGTRYCDWWFTEDAVLIDTAGRYTTQDSDAKSDKKSWFSFLDLLKKNRPRQPINGVIVAISLEDLMTLSSAEIASHSDAIRARLLELHDRLKVDFPVYAVFTKGDLVAGFMEFFGSLGENGRKQVWGATFQTNDKTRNLVGEVPFEFDALIERLNIDLTDRLQEEPAPSTRVALFGFPAQMAALKRHHLRFSQFDLRADPLSRECDAARLLFHFRNAGRHANRSGDRRVGPELRCRRSRRRILFGKGPQLLPHRPDQQGHHRRGGLGLDRLESGSARPDPEGGRLYLHPRVRRRRGDRMVGKLQPQSRSDRADRYAYRGLPRGGRPARDRKDHLRPRSRTGRAPVAAAALPARRLCEPRNAGAARREVRA